MTTYDASAVSNSVIAHKKGITLQQGRALRDNPIAIAEGSATAPRVQGQALGNVLMDHGSLSSWGLSATANVEQGKTFVALVNFAAPATSSNIKVRLSDDNGSTAATQSTIMTVGTPAPAFLTGQFSIDVTTGNYTWTDTNTTSPTTGTATLPAGDVNAIELFGSGQITGILFCVGGTA